MNKSYLIHGVWVVVAIAAYAFGSRSSGSSDQHTSESNSRSSAVSTRISNRGTSSKSNSRSKNSLAQRPESNSRSYSETDLIKLGTDFKNAKGPIERRLAFSEILKALTSENALLLREQIVHLDQDSAEFREFHYAWGSLAGETAVTHGEETKKRDMAATLAGWMNADPDAAMAYFNALDPKRQNDRGGLKWGAVFGLVDTDPARAAEFVAARFEAGDRDAGKMINIATDAVFRSGDQGEVTAFLASIPGGEIEIQAHQHAARKYAQDDPAGTAEWASRLPEGDGKNHAVGTSFHVWAGQNPKEAAAAIASMPASQKDAARYGYATRVVHDDPAVGVEWATSINNPDARQRALYDTGKTFFRKEPEAARVWLPKSGLPAATQQKLLDRANRKGR